MKHEIDHHSMCDHTECGIYNCPNAMLFTLHITNTDEFFALEEALDQFVMNTEDIEDELREKGDDKSLETLRRLEAGRKLLNIVTAVLCSLADNPQKEPTP